MLRMRSASQLDVNFGSYMSINEVVSEGENEGDQENGLGGSNNIHQNEDYKEEQLRVSLRKRRRLGDGSRVMVCNSSEDEEISDGFVEDLERDLRSTVDDTGKISGMEDYSGVLIDLGGNTEQEAFLQPVVEIDDEDDSKTDTTCGSKEPVTYKRVLDYKCPICFDPPEAALMTQCGHVFCTVCLFQMVTSSRGYKRNGQCALCRKDVKLKDVVLIILRKKRVRKKV